MRGVLYDAMGNVTGYDDPAPSDAPTVQPVYTPPRDFGINTDGWGDPSPFAAQNEVVATTNPDIVKIHLPAGVAMPDWVRATSIQPDGSVIGYGPTATAIAKGYLIAAGDTIAELPDRAAEALKSAAGVGTLALIALAAIFMVMK